MHLSHSSPATWLCTPHNLLAAGGGSLPSKVHDTLHASHAIPKPDSDPRRLPVIQYWLSPVLCRAHISWPCCPPAAHSHCARRPRCRPALKPKVAPTPAHCCCNFVLPRRCCRVAQTHTPSPEGKGKINVNNPVGEKRDHLWLLGLFRPATPIVHWVQGQGHKLEFPGPGCQ